MAVVERSILLSGFERGDKNKAGRRIRIGFIVPFVGQKRKKVKQQQDVFSER